jgi:hypothetical protein
MKTSACSRRGVPTMGVRVIASIPPRNAGAGSETGSLFSL